MGLALAREARHKWVPETPRFALGMAEKKRWVELSGVRFCNWGRGSEGFGGKGFGERNEKRNGGDDVVVVVIAMVMASHRLGH